MIPQANITAWRASAPWPDDAQVEQDLVLSRAVVELFSVSDLADAIALRGGTSLNKLFIDPPARYSEDIDLVQSKPGKIGPILDAIRDKLDSWLGKPSRSRAVGCTALVYRFESEIAPVRPLRLKIEINTREHFTVMGFHRPKLSVRNPWFSGGADVTTYQLDELLGTKLRALYQRRKGRDLFDLWLCLSRKLIDPDQAARCFLKYMEHEGHRASRAQFEQNLHEKERDPEFMGDIAPLLNAVITYDPAEAIGLVRRKLIERIPGDPWRGSNPS
jgi:predicted nucleotidyltransferase component of viral defense system